MEPVRHSEPDLKFLNHIKERAEKTGAVLIFDEVTSAWRKNVGGIHLLLGVSPDISIFAKGISNGYPMAAIIGKKAVMDSAQETFISSTYWTERIGPTAALSVIKKIKTHSVVDHLNKTGEKIQKTWCLLAEKYSLNIEISGAPSLCHFSFNGSDAVVFKTLFTQLMLEKGDFVFAALRPEGPGFLSFQAGWSFQRA